MNIHFEGGTVLVTGAGHGIGRGIAQAFVALGARTIAGDVNMEGLAETVTGGVGGGGTGTLSARRLDVTSRAAQADAVAEIGQIDVLVRSAGGVCGQVGVSVTDVREAAWHAILSVNLTGAFLTAQAVVPVAGKRREAQPQARVPTRENVGCPPSRGSCVRRASSLSARCTLGCDDFQHVNARVGYRENTACCAEPPDQPRLLSSVNGQSHAQRVQTEIGGWRFRHGAAVSSCADTRNRVASAPNPAPSITPSGSPAAFQCSGSVIAGLPVAL